MRYLKSLTIMAFAIVTAVATLYAADEPLEIHGGGRIGVTVNSKLGSETGPVGGNNAMGTMPNYGESHYFGISLGKKVTSEGGAWAKVSYYTDYHTGDYDGDLYSHEWRVRDFHVEFGGLDFMPEGSVLWAGLRGYGSGWNGMQDHSFINMAGIGFGVQNIGGLVSIAYMSQDGSDADTTNDIDDDANGDAHDADAAGEYIIGNAGWMDLGEKTLHNIIVNVNTPMIEVYAALGYMKGASATDPEYDAGEDEDDLTEYYVGAIYHAPVMGINIGLAVSTNGYAKEIYGNDYDTMLKNHSGANSTAVGGKDSIDYTGVRALIWTVTDLAPGLYIAPSIRYDMLICGEDTTEGVAAGGENTFTKIDIAVRLSKALTKNIAFVPVVGFERITDSEEIAYPDPKQTMQGTVAVEIGLDTGYWAGQKIQFYGTYTKVDSDHKFVGGAYDDKDNSLCFGTLVTFGF